MPAATRLPIFLPLLLGLAFVSASAFADEPADRAAVSYERDVLPIFQGKCHGCHQPAKAQGGYDMLSFDKLVAGGESTLTAVVPGKPDQSYLLEQIAVVDGEAEMPKNGDPLSKAEIETIRLWIEQGAKIDASETRSLHDAQNPPVYVTPPVVTSLDYSPDGSLLAVAGYHEVLLKNADGSGEPRRFVGLSERIESVEFSPDGKRLAAVGGNPGRRGEVQVWDVESGELLLSHPVTYDTIYGASWSPDGTLIAFGCADNTLRAINATTGEQVLFQGSHNDWVRDTVFSNSGEFVVSVGRDMTAKLTRLKTNRFIDNITSITPKALKGGINAVDRHPSLELILIGGADGQPKVYRMERKTNRVIGDDANIIRKFPSVPGRIFAVDYAPDGKSIVVGSSLDGRGVVQVYAAPFDDALPNDIKAIHSKRANQWNEMERAKMEAFITKDVSVTSTTELPTGVYSVAFSPDSKTVAASGADGMVRLIDAASGDVRKEFSPVPLSSESEMPPPLAADPRSAAEEDAAREALPKGLSITSIEVSPADVMLEHLHDSVQMVVTGRRADGTSIDLTRHASYSLSTGVVELAGAGLLRPVLDGSGFVEVRFGDASANVPVSVKGLGSEEPVSYVREVTPVLSKLGCNQGTCHGAKDGKNGFKLSLRGYDPLYDIRALTDDLASRRVNIASPDRSLMLLKATGRVPHAGGQLTRVGETNYEVLRKWIAEGAKLDLTAPKVLAIRLEPENPVVQQIGGKQQLRVVASYEDGSERDVTTLSFVESGNTDVAETEENGLVKTLRRGEAPLLARFEGAYAATTITVMGDRSGFEWKQPAEYNRIDELVSSKLQRMKILPSGLCTDAEFIRRVSLDLTGLPPQPEQVRAFLDDPAESKVKRAKLVESLIGSEPFVDHWTNKWADLLQVNRKFLGPEGAKTFRAWIREQVAQNRPYDEFVYDVLTASGSNRENPAVSYYKILRTPEETMENTTHLFLAIRFNCNKCHDHPFERWTQDQYYETAAFFAQVGLKADPGAKGKRIGGTAVEGAKPLYEIVYDKPSGDVTHERTGAVTAPEFPFLEEYTTGDEQSRREQLASWMTSPENPYFAKSYVNRVWGYLLGVGLIEPLDDIRAGNPPSNPELLDYLTEEFIRSGFDTRALIRLICDSATYQRSIEANAYNADDTTNYSHAVAKRLPAEVLFDAIHTTLGATPAIPGVPKGTRAAQLPDAGVRLPDGFLANLGRPVRESACECERSSDLQLGPVMALVGGPTLGNALSDPTNDLAALAKSSRSDEELIREVVLRILARPATDKEVRLGLDLIRGIEEDHALLQEELTAYKAQIAPREQERAAAREKRIADAKLALEAYRGQHAEVMRKAAADRQARIDATTKALADYEATLDQQAETWAESATKSTGWVPLTFDTLTSTNRAKLTQESDRSVLVSGPNGKTAYRLSASSDLTSITGLRLEALADPRIGSPGPGRNSNGNFVLTELTLEAAAKGKSDFKKIAFGKATATYSQGGYAVQTAVDGKVAGAGNGWAISPKVGEDQTAVFELKSPIAFETGAALKFDLNQQYQDGKHSLGKFRISVTSDPLPLAFGMPKAVVDALAVTAADRSDAQRKAILDHFKQSDKQWVVLNKAKQEALKPLAKDPELARLEAAVAQAEEPLKVDPALARLERAVDLSAKQLAAKRLTAAQDLAWALINSPAFLFNR